MGSGQKSLDEEAFLEQLGVRVRRARARAGLTRRRLSLLSGVSERFLAQLESGEGNISIVLIRRVAAALGAELVELIGSRIDTSRRGRFALTGLRGAGKSTLGARLAERLAVPFFELDAAVVHDLGLPLDALFAPSGQDMFREAERRVLAQLIERHERCVITTSGSLVLDPQTYSLLRGRCFTVWLKALPEDHLSRVLAQGDLRPIQGREHALTELRTILAQRERLYSMADTMLDTSVHDEAQALNALLALAIEAGHTPVTGPGTI